MTTTISAAAFTGDLLFLLEEAFENVHGVFLDQGTSLFETLAGISAAEASIPVGGKCATLAAQVAHITFYLDVVERFVRTGQNAPVDWGEVWRTMSGVTSDAWADLQTQLRQAYARTQETIRTFEHWEVEHSLGGAMGILAHTAYHLGEIRQATCILKK